MGLKSTGESALGRPDFIRLPSPPASITAQDPCGIFYFLRKPVKAALRFSECAECGDRIPFTSLFIISYLPDFSSDSHKIDSPLAKALVFLKQRSKISVGFLQKEVAFEFVICYNTI
jgi:hypothetical protein